MLNKLLFFIFPLIAIACYSYFDVFRSISVLVLGTLLLVPYFIKYCTRNKVGSNIWRFFIIVVIASVLNLITTENGIGGTIIFFGSFVLAIFALNNLKLVQWVILLIGLFLLYFLYVQIFINNVRVDDVFEDYGQSRNYPGCLLVTISCFWGMCKAINYKSMPLLFPIIAVIFCFFLDGRSSLGIMIAIVFYCLGFRSQKYLLISLGVTLFAIFYFSEYLIDMMENSRLFMEGTDSNRYQLWGTYIKNLDLPSFLFGLETKYLPLLRDYGGNPHNSFFNFHYRMGILGLGALIVLLVKSLVLLWKQKQKEIFIFLVLLWIRMSFDTCIVSATDFLVFTMMFYPFYNKTNTKENVTKHSKTRNKNLIIKLGKKIIDLV